MIRRSFAIFLAISLLSGSVPSDAFAFHPLVSSTILAPVFTRNALLEADTQFPHPLRAQDAIEVRQWVSRHPRVVAGIGVAATGLFAWGLPHLWPHLAAIPSRLWIHATLILPMAGAAVWGSWLRPRSKSYEPFMAELLKLVTSHATRGTISLSQIRFRDVPLPEEDLDSFLVALNNLRPYGLHFERIPGTTVIAYEQNAVYYAHFLDPGDMSAEKFREILKLGKKESLSNSIDLINKSNDIPLFISMKDGETLHMEAVDISVINAKARKFAQNLQPIIQRMHLNFAALRARLRSGAMHVKTPALISITNGVDEITAQLSPIHFVDSVKTLDEKGQRIFQLNNSHYGRNLLLEVTYVDFIVGEEDIRKTSSYLEKAENGLKNFERYLEFIAEMKEWHFMPQGHGVLNLNAEDAKPSKPAGSVVNVSALSDRFDQRVEQTARVEALTLESFNDPTVLKRLDAEFEDDQTHLARELYDRLTDHGSSLAVMGENLVTRTLNGYETQTHMLSIPLVDLTKLGAAFEIDGFTDIFKARLHQKIAEAVHRDHPDASVSLRSDVAVMASRILISNVSEEWVSRNLPSLIEQVRGEMQAYAPRERKGDFALALRSLKFKRSGARIYTKNPSLAYALRLPPLMLLEILGAEFNLDDFALNLVYTLEEKFLERISKQKVKKADRIKFRRANTVVSREMIAFEHLSYEWLTRQLPGALDEMISSLAESVPAKQRGKFIEKFTIRLKNHFFLTGLSVPLLDPEREDFQALLEFNKPAKQTGMAPGYDLAYDYYLSRRREMLSESIGFWIKHPTLQNARQKASVLTAYMIQDLVQRLNERLEVVEKSTGELAITINKVIAKNPSTPTIPNLDDRLIQDTIDELEKDADIEPAAELYRALSDGRDKTVPFAKYDPDNPLALPRISHLLPSWNADSPSLAIGALRQALARLHSPDRTEADLQTFKDYYREYQLMIGVALVTSTQDPRLPIIYKRDGIEQVVEADRTGAAQRFRRHLEHLLENLVQVSSEGLIETAQQTIETMEPGYFPFKRGWGDEFGLVKRDVREVDESEFLFAAREVNYYEGFSEVNKLNAYMTKYMPDAMDSTYHKVLIAYREAVRNHIRKRNVGPLDVMKDFDTILRQIAPEHFNPTVKVPTENGTERMPAYKPIGENVAPTHALDRHGYFWILKESVDPLHPILWVRDDQKHTAAELGVDPFIDVLSNAIMYVPHPVTPDKIGHYFDWMEKVVIDQKQNPNAIHEAIDLTDIIEGRLQPGGRFKTGIHLYSGFIHKAMQWLEAQPAGAFIKFQLNPHYGRLVETAA